MKKFTWKQIYNAFVKALKEDYHSSDLLKDIANAPFYTTVVNLNIRMDMENKSCRESQYFEVPVRIMIKDADIERAVCMEVATQLFKFEGFTYYSDDYTPLICSNIVIETRGIYSFSSDRQYAIFHQEQECGCSWLVIREAELSAPFTYQKESACLKRSETNLVYSAWNKNRR